MKAVKFLHPKKTIEYWRALASQALSTGIATPLYLFSVEPIKEALAELKKWERAIVGGAGSPPALRVRHWLSFKTQPLHPLLQWWLRDGGNVEVVSEFELQAALQEGFPGDRILVNGPAKHHWLLRHPVPGLRVNFDSPTEIAALLPLAKKCDWSLGLRIHTREEFDPEYPDYPTQFGLEEKAAVVALAQLRREKVRLETVHFHLRTNVAKPLMFERAVAEVAEICRAAEFAPRYLDIGGGLPPRHVLTRGGKPVNATFEMRKWADALGRAVKAFPGLAELWLENGRFLSARSGVLVVKVLDVKERRGLRQLICDGGRTMNALLSIWEQHELVLLPARKGDAVMTVVCGPTCMAFDQLARRLLPGDLGPGDHLIWLEAGAYHLPWETRFSHGLAAVLWHENGGLKMARARESFSSWWGQWLGPA